jgi:hypothetical protein
MSDQLWMIAGTYRVCYTVLAGGITAYLAPSRPTMHAVVLGVVGTCIGTIGAMATWNLGPEFGPKWFQIGLAATALPSCWLGVKFLGVLRGSNEPAVAPISPKADLI